MSSTLLLILKFKNSDLWRFLTSMEFDLEKKSAEPVCIHRGLAEPSWALIHAQGQKKKNQYQEIKTRLFEKLCCFLQLDYINYFFVRNQ